VVKPTPVVQTKNVAKTPVAGVKRKAATLENNPVPANRAANKSARGGAATATTASRAGAPGAAVKRTAGTRSVVKPGGKTIPLKKTSNAPGSGVVPRIPAKENKDPALAVIAKDDVDVPLPPQKKKRAAWDTKVCLDR
jgi:hypothetical protein